MINNYPERIKQVAGNVSDENAFFVTDINETEWKVPSVLIQRTRLIVETKAYAKVLKDVGAGQELAEEYPETPNLVEYLKTTKNSWIAEKFEEGADENQIKEELRNLFFAYAFEFANDVDVLSIALREIDDLSMYTWEKVGK